MSYLAAIELKHRVFALFRFAPLRLSQHVHHLVFVGVLRHFPLLDLRLVLLFAKRIMSAILLIANIQKIKRSMVPVPSIETVVILHGHHRLRKGHIQIHI